MLVCERVRIEEGSPSMPGRQEYDGVNILFTNSFVSGVQRKRICIRFGAAHESRRLLISFLCPLPEQMQLVVGGAHLYVQYCVI